MTGLVLPRRVAGRKKEGKERDGVVPVPNDNCTHDHGLITGLPVLYGMDKVFQFWAL